MKLTRILLPVIAILLMASPATWAQMAPAKPSQPSAAVGAAAQSTKPAAKTVQGTVKSIDQAKGDRKSGKEKATQAREKKQKPAAIVNFPRKRAVSKGHQ